MTVYFDLEPKANDPPTFHPAPSLLLFVTAHVPTFEHVTARTCAAPNATSAQTCDLSHTTCV